MLTVLSQPVIGISTQGKPGVDGTDGKAGADGVDGKGFGATYRPGDAPGSFTSALAGSSAGGLPAAAGFPGASPSGAVFVLASGGTIATRDAVWLEPDAFFAVRIVFGRTVDGSSLTPRGAVVGVQWLDANFAALSQSLIAEFPSLDAKEGVKVLSARIPSAIDDLRQITAPINAAFWRPFVRDLSADGKLAISSMTVSDVTNSGVYAPDLSRLIAEIRALKSRVSQIGG